MNGLNHNLVVRKLDNGKFELISGERRVIEANNTDAEIILIQANAQTRELTEVEKIKQVQILKELYKDKKAKEEKVSGKIREIIANDLKLSTIKVGRYEKINSSLIPELKNILEKGNLTIATASEFANLSEDNQKVILELINSNVNLSKNKAIELEKELENKYSDKLNSIKNEVKNLS